MCDPVRSCRIGGPTGLLLSWEVYARQEHDDKTMIDYVVYGKIIIDDVRLIDGSFVRSVLGGGGPQAAFGIRLWADSVGFLSRSGTDIEDEHVESLKRLGIDLQGWVQYDDIPTARTLMQYDEKQYLLDGYMITSREDWDRLLAQVLPLPATYTSPKLVHLVTEYHNEPMVGTALALQEKGAILSVEPLVNYRNWGNKDSILELIRQAEVVSPDWPSASGIADSADPRTVMRYWARLGPSVVAVRNGPDGSYLWGRDHDQICHIPAVPVEVVDPTGAGNCYSGALAAGWSLTKDSITAACYGAVAASFLVRQLGMPPMSAELRDEAHALLTQTLAQVAPL